MRAAPRFSRLGPDRANSMEFNMARGIIHEMESLPMTVAELLPSLKSLPRNEKLQVIQWLAEDLARDEEGKAGESIVMAPSDQCPYTPAELARMRNETGGRTLAEIRESRG